MTAPGAAGRRGALALPILAAVLAAFGGLLTGGVLYFRDIGLLHRPVRLLARAAWAAGRLPLWDPFMDGGRPLLANPNHRLLHPSALLDTILDVDHAFAAAVVLQVFLAGWGLARLLSECGLDDGAARLGGLAWALSGPLLSLGNLPNLLAGMAWLPLAVWAGLRAQTGSRRALAAAAALTAVPLLAGGLETAAVILVLLALMAVSGPRRLRALGATAGVAAGAALLAAIQILPALATLRGSERGLGFRSEQLLHWSMPPVRLLEALVPGLWGVATDPAGWWGAPHFDTGVPLVLSTYVGATAAALAVAGMAALRPGGALPAPVRRLLPALLAVAAALIFLALGRHNPLLSLAGRTPLLGAWLRYPERLLPLAAAAPAVAAAAGWHALSRRRHDGAALPAWGWAGLAAGLLPAGVLAVLAAAGRMPLSPTLSDARRVAAAATFAPAAATAALAVALLGGCLWLAGRPGRGKLAAGCAAALLAMDLLAAGVALNPTAEAGIFEEVPEAARVMRQMAGPGEVPRLWRHSEPSVSGEGIPPGVEVVWSRRSLSERIPSEFGLGTSLLSDVDRSAPLGNAVLRMAHARAEGTHRERLADRAGATWELLFADAPGQVPDDAVWSGAVFPRAPLVALRVRPDAAPRFSAVPKGTWMGRLADAEVLSRTLAAMADPQRSASAEVFLTGDAEGAVASAWTPGSAQILLLQDRPGDIRLAVTMPAAGVLVARESFVTGWQVEVDGEPAAALRADLAWLGVPLAEGPHQVRLTFRQPGLLGGAALTLLGLILVGVLVAGGRIRRPGLESP